MYGADTLVQQTAVPLMRKIILIELFIEPKIGMLNEVNWVLCMETVSLTCNLQHWVLLLKTPPETGLKYLLYLIKI